MKAKIIIVLFTILLLIGVSVFFIFNKVQQKEEKRENYQSIPNFQLPDINGNIITNNSLQKDKTVVFLFISPDCDFCVEELKQIKDNQAALSKGEMVFVSTWPAEPVRNFLQKIDFTLSENMQFLSDEKGILFNAMAIIGSPTALIYKKGELAKRFDGPITIETLIKYLSE